MDRRTIGVISDTHGLVRPEALQALQGSSLIVHAGDIGGSRVLETLGTIAPVVAVRGNTDAGEWADALPKSEVVEIGETRLYVIHDIHELDIDPVAAEFGAVICGHSHRPSIQSHNGVLLLNPGSAGPRRFGLQPSVALIHVRKGSLDPRIVQLIPRADGQAR